MRILGSVAVVPVLAAVAAASGTLQGLVLDEKGAPVVGALIRLENKVSGYRQHVRTTPDGRFVLRNVPYGDYHVEVDAAGLVAAHRNIEVRSALPIDLSLAMKPAGAEVVVEERSQLLEDHASVHLHIDKSTIDKIPAAVQSRAMESILLATPGFVQDENGRFHMKGSHGQVMYMIDGIPVTDQVQATFSNSLDPSQVESLEIITGGISAEFGGKPVAVVNLTSRSGLGASDGFEGDVTFGASRFKTFEGAFSARGGTSAFGYFVSGAASGSDRFLDPVNFENLHNTGRTSRLFLRLDWLLSDRDTLRVSLSGGSTRRDVVNLASQEARGQDQTARNRDSNLSVAWTHLLDANRSFDAALFQRSSSARLDPTTDLQPGFQGGGPDFPVWARQDRSLDNLGAQVAYTQRFGEDSLKVGLQHVRYPVREAFAFAITDPDAIQDPDDPLYAYTPAGGGAIFNFDGKVTPTLTSAYVQTDWHAGPLFLAAGLRVDRYKAKAFSETSAQPRLGLSYGFPATGTVLRASYDRLLITPENENLALSLSQQAWDLGPRAGTPAPPLRSERQDSYSYGVEQQLGQVARFSIEYWEKKAVNAADNEQFLNTGVLFPIAAERGLYRGVNLRFDLIPVRGFSAYLSLGKTRAIFQAPVVGGLQLESSEAGPGERFLIDHDQKIAAQLGLRFERGSFHAQAIGRYDSGLVAGDPAQAAGNPDLAFGIPFVTRDGEGTFRTKARTIWSLSVGRELKLSGKRALQLSADLLNATDEKGLYNFLSVFGGTHVIPPRTLALRTKFKF